MTTTTDLDVYMTIARACGDEPSEADQTYEAMATIMAKQIKGGKFLLLVVDMDNESYYTCVYTPNDATFESFNGDILIGTYDDHTNFDLDQKAMAVQWFNKQYQVMK